MVCGRRGLSVKIRKKGQKAAAGLPDCDAGTCGMTMAFGRQKERVRLVWDRKDRPRYGG